MYWINKITANPTIDFAAEELKKYLRMMMPRCGEVPISYNPEAKDGFRVGLMADFGLDMSDAEDILLDDIICIEADEQGGIIAGSNPGATLIAVYRYLRAQGCRWLFPGIDGEWIPVAEGLTAVSYRKLADYRYRGQCNEGGEFQQDMIEVIDFTPKIGMNTFMIEFDNPSVYYNFYYEHEGSTTREPEPVSPQMVLQWKRQCEAEIQKRGLHLHDMGHGWTAEPFGIDTTSGWAHADNGDITEETCRYMAEIKGERKPFNGSPLCTNICMSSPEARRIVVNYIADYAAAQNNVDFLHIWLADDMNNHCECENCRKKTPSDWYIILLNELDAELEKRNLATHLVFIAYVDTLWAPVVERLNNNKRFTLLAAIGCHRFNDSYSGEADMSLVEPFRINQNVMPRSMAGRVAYLKKWQEIWKGDCFMYGYHFMRTQYYDPSGLSFARMVHEDVLAMKKLGLKGIVEDGSQRSYFPNGLAYYVYGETLYDASVSFEALAEDYYRHAYGADWKQAMEFMTEIGKKLDCVYLHDMNKRFSGQERTCLPEYAEKAAQVHSLTAAFAPVVRRNRVGRYRAAQVAWKLMEYFLEFAEGVADIQLCLARCDGAGAQKMAARLIDAFSAHEIYIERWYDQFMASCALKEMATCAVNETER